MSGVDIVTVLDKNRELNGLPEAGVRFLNKERADRDALEKELRIYENKKNVRFREKRTRDTITRILEEESRPCFRGGNSWILAMIICLCIPIFGWIFFVAMCMPCNYERRRRNRLLVLQAAREGDAQLKALDLDDNNIMVEC
jgi:hypothetical protein